MADRADFYFRQRVTEAELDLAFALLEKADRDLAADLNIYGIVAGAVPAPHSPVPDLTVDLTAPGRAYDNLGQRMFFGTGQTVDCAVDLVGIPTDVATVGNERWLGIFLRFKRQLSDPRTDGNSQQVFFRRDESFELVVRQAPEGAIGVAPKPALQADELLVCDVRRRPGQTQILVADIDTSRRQAFIFAQGTSVAVTIGTWSILQPLAATVQAAFDETDAELRDHFTAVARRHAASAIDYTSHGFVGAGNVQAAVDELIDDLATGAVGSSGATRVGVDAAAGAPNALPAGSVKSQLAQLLGFLNTHVSAPTGAHNAAAIAATPHNNVAATNVQSQLQEIVTDLVATSAAAPGAGLVGVDAIAGAPTAIAAGTLRAALVTLLGSLNGHVNQAAGAHAASAISVADAGNNLNAANVETALAEVLDAYEGDHFRGNEANPGQHRTIRQPNLGGTKALLWDAQGNGGIGARLRVYADSDNIWFTLNASWNGSAWARDSTSYFAGGFRFSRLDFEFMHEDSFAATFTTWTRRWVLPMSSTVNSAFELTGSVQETGRLGLEWTNADTSLHTLALGGAVTFRNRFPAAPSSITLTPSSVGGGFSGNPSTFSVDRDGFGFFSFQSMAGLQNMYWFGRYTAVA
ncbi:hypothetical protein NVS55_08140 [Myxococcus stipitatus]|uniref:hypothetical protein n=1 Tax=Myxococcus stipitatus TaxID=83455 RepID=UPI003145008F